MKSSSPLRTKKKGNFDPKIRTELPIFRHLICDKLKVAVQKFPVYRRRTEGKRELEGREPWVSGTGSGVPLQCTSTRLGVRDDSKVGGRLWLVTCTVVYLELHWGRDPYVRRVDNRFTSFLFDDGGSGRVLRLSTLFTYKNNKIILGDSNPH